MSAHLSWISSIFLRSAIGQKSMEKRMMYVSSVVMISSPICNKHEMKKRLSTRHFCLFVSQVWLWPRSKPGGKGLPLITNSQKIPHRIVAKNFFKKDCHQIVATIL